MGYDVHITRKANWWEDDGSAITLDEWRNLVASDSEMRLVDEGQATSPGGATIRYENPGLAVWERSPESTPGEDVAQVWFDLRAGNITVRNPDEQVLGRMLEMARPLGAKVQGDEGEVYEEGAPFPS